MKSLLAAIAIAALAAILPVAAQQPPKVAADKGFIRFIVKQMNAPVEGRFRKFEGTASFDPAHPEATKGEFEVDLASIDLGSEEGETEAKGKLWLNVAAFPKAKFVAASVKPLGGNKFEVRGNLTIKGTTQPVVTNFTLSEAGGTRTVEGEFPLKRLQYKIGEGIWSDTATVADEVLVRYRFILSSNR